LPGEKCARHAYKRACRPKRVGRSIDKIKRNRQLGKVAAKNVADYKWGLRQQSTSCGYEGLLAVSYQLSATSLWNIARVLALSAGYNSRTVKSFWRRWLIMPHGSTRLGLFLFAVYLALYSGFVLLAAFAPQAMEATPLAGVNLAIWYGFGLIAAALVLALIYGWARRLGPQASIDSVEKPGDRP
jgi:uncharacterized membrane protein (DUF485 family)